jgi:DNA-binding LytR/AlgR family response regulator
VPPTPLTGSSVSFVPDGIVVYCNWKGKEERNMTVKMEKFMKKHCFDQQQIRYILREQGKTCIHLTDGRVIAAYLTIRELMESLPEGDFLQVSQTCLIEEETPA